MTRARRLLLLASTLLAACGAEPRSGIVAEVTTDLRVPAELDEVQVVATNAAGKTLYERSFPLTGPAASSLPLRVGFEASGGSPVPFRVEAIGLHGSARIVSRSATLPFARGRVVVLPLPLLAVCGHTFCSEAKSTCKETGACAPDTVEPGALPTYQPATDAAAPTDGGAEDAGRESIDVGAKDADTPQPDGSLPDAIVGDGVATDAAPDKPPADAPPADAPSDARDASVTDLPRDLPPIVASLSTGLVGYWSFDTNATVFPDHSGNQNDIALPAGVVLWTVGGVYGGGLDLTGDKSVGVTASASVNTITKAITIAAYAKVPPAGMTHTMISRYLGVGYWKLGFAANGAVVLTLGPQVIQSVAGPAAGTYVHVAATYDGATANIYVAGALVTTGQVAAVSLAGGPAAGGPGGYGPLLGGTFMDASAITIEYFQASLDELTLYNRALSGNEVAALSVGIFPARVPK